MGKSDREQINNSTKYNVTKITIIQKLQAFKLLIFLFRFSKDCSNYKKNCPYIFQVQFYSATSKYILLIYAGKTLIYSIAAAFIHFKKYSRNF